ncbi:3-isopropylmalate dehydratase large subunit, partial [Tyzzerella sp. OttesenSCG-928-J15]|nr:3-isopropylmalate dehydratase large subunit [Tyzzerella sp. OttesenSCG-928-J15]
EGAGGNLKVNNSDKICVVLDHFTPNKDIKSAQMSKDCREFCANHGIESFYDVGEMGIEHCLIPEKGIVAPGDLEVGSDSHTCTYGALGAFSTGIGTTDLACAMATGKLWFKVPAAVKFVLKGKPSKMVSGKDLILHIIGMIGVDGARYKSMEYVGEGVKYLSMDDRFTICNMAIEAGGKNGIFPVDEKTREYVAAHPAEKRLNKQFEVFEADADAEYDEVYEIDLSQLKPTVSYPHSPENTKLAKELEEIEIDQVVLGSCTNGRISDLRIAAEILRGKQVKKGLRVIIIPGSQEIYLQALKEGLIEDFIKAGAAVSTPTCGPCWGGHMGVLAKGEKCVSTTNRNFIGRMGHNESMVYLASPATAAASALTGKITSPESI